MLSLAEVVVVLLELPSLDSSKETSPLRISGARHPTVPGIQMPHSPQEKLLVAGAAAEVIFTVPLDLLQASNVSFDACSPDRVKYCDGETSDQSREDREYNPRMTAEPVPDPRGLLSSLIGQS